MIEDKDIDWADTLVNVDPALDYAVAHSTQAQAYALISIAKTLRRLEAHIIESALAAPVVRELRDLQDELKKI